MSTNLTAVGVHLIQSIWEILATMFAHTKRNKRLKSEEQAFVNVVSTTVAYSNVEDVNGLTKFIIAREMGFSTGAAHRNLKKGEIRAAQLQEGSLKNFTWGNTDSERTKYSNEELDNFSKWCCHDCKLLIFNPIKDDNVYKQDKQDCISNCGWDCHSECKVGDRMQFWGLCC